MVLVVLLLLEGQLLYLFLVCLDLLLELVNQFLHPLVVLVVLLLLEGQLLDPPVHTTLVLLGINQASLFLIELALELTDLLLQALNDLSTSLHGQGLSLIQLGLHVLDLVLHAAALSLHALGALLLNPELIGKPGSINHSLLGFLLRKPSFSKHFLQVSMQGLHF